MKIFIIYESSGLVWKRAYTSFEAAIDDVSSYVYEQNLRAKNDGHYDDYEDRPARMEKDPTYRDEQGGLMVSHNELEKMSTFIKQLFI